MTSVMNYEYNVCVGGTERQTPSRVETDTTFVDEQEKSLKEMAYKWSPRLEDVLSCDTLAVWWEEMKCLIAVVFMSTLGIK